VLFLRVGGNGIKLVMFCFLRGGKTLEERGKGGGGEHHGGPVRGQMSLNIGDI